MAEPRGAAARVKASDQSELFGEGWLSQQLDTVVRELVERSPDGRPRLTGARASTMADNSWLHVHDR
jgi:hypothetical protein